MNIAVTGASGFIGCRLTARFEAEGHVVRTISLRQPLSEDAFTGCDGVVHLAGESVAQRWSREVKQRILDSRVNGTRSLVEAMRQHPPRVLISASAVGYYGSRGDDILTEEEPPGNDFLAGVCAAWEREAMEAAKLHARVVTLRIGMVLGAGGGALQRMLRPFRLGAGGRIGGGRQWMSWIHINDLCDLILFAARGNSLSRAVNAVSPNPVKNADFTQALARTLRRPALFPLPSFAVQIVFGEMSELLLASQRALPEAALRAGFTFQHAEISQALKDVLTA